MMLKMTALLHWLKEEEAVLLLANLEMNIIRIAYFRTNIKLLLLVQYSTT